MEEIFEAVFKFAFRAILFVLRIFGQMLAEVVAQIFCYYTTRMIAPVISLGYVSVETFRGPPSRFNAWGVKREANGDVLLSADLAILLGLVFWLSMIIGGALFASSPTDAGAHASSFAITSSEIS